MNSVLNLLFVYIAGHGLARRTIGPRAFWVGLAQKSAHVLCLGCRVGTVAYGGTTWWHAGHTGPCLAWSRAGPGWDGLLLNFIMEAFVPSSLPWSAVRTSCSSSYECSSALHRSRRWPPSAVDPGHWPQQVLLVLVLLLAAAATVVERQNREAPWGQWMERCTGRWRWRWWLYCRCHMARTGAGKGEERVAATRSGRRGKKQREREKWMRVCCLLPVVGASICCRRGERRRVSLARVGSWAWQVAARRAGVEGIG